jgi:hypothetical protein
MKSVLEDLRYKLVGEINRTLSQTADEARYRRLDNARTVGEFRSEFTKLIDRLCEIFLQLCEKHPNLQWTEPGSGKICPEIGAQIRYLVALACYPSGPELRALAGWPNKIPPEQENMPVASALLDAATPGHLLEAVKNHVAKKLRERARNPLTGEMKSRTRPRRRLVEPTLIRAMIASVKRDHPEESSNIKHMCKLLDLLKVPVPRGWKKAGKFTWSEAWAEPKFRPRVKAYISGVPSALKNQAQPFRRPRCFGAS